MYRVSCKQNWLSIVDVPLKTECKEILKNHFVCVCVCAPVERTVKNDPKMVRSRSGSNATFFLISPGRNNCVKFIIDIIENKLYMETVEHRVKNTDSGIRQPGFEPQFLYLRAL